MVFRWTFFRCILHLVFAEILAKGFLFKDGHCRFNTDDLSNGEWVYLQIFKKRFSFVLEYQHFR